MKAAHWNDISFKDKAAYITAISSFFLGWILLFLGMLLPPMGEIAPSVITAFGTALVYTASIFGIFLYIKGNNTEIYSKIMESVQEQLTTLLNKKQNDTVK